MIYLILAILSSTFVALTMRYGESHCKNKISMLAINYVLCTVCALIQTGPKNLCVESGSIGLGTIQGILYLSGFLLFQYNINKNGVVLSSTFMKLGVLVPTLAAIFVFREMPTILQIIGIVLSIASILLINLEKGTSQATFKMGLVILLIVGGMTDIMAKIYSEYGIDEHKDQFIFFTFLTALVLITIICFGKKQSLAKEDVLCGLLIGVPNYFSAVFLLRAVQHVMATIAYPTYSVSTIVCTTMGGILFFKEKITKRQAIAIVIILVAVVMLNI